MKKIGLSVLVGLVVSSSLAFAATPTTSEIKNMSNRLNTHKNTLIKNLENSEKKLEKQAKEAKSFTETSLFQAASCLNAIPESNQNLDFSTLSKDLKTKILNEYIKLDGDIKRYEFGMNTSDPVIFSNSLENFYNQNAIKITNFENDYYLKVNATKKTFLEYVENNKDLLNGLAQKLQTISLIDSNTKQAQEAFSGLMQALDTKTALWKNMLSNSQDNITKLENDLNQIMMEIITKYNPSGEVQAKFLIHKDNFLNKFKAESNKAVFQIFEKVFDYAEYLNLTDKHSQLHKTFDDTNGKLNCNILLTTNHNFTPYLNAIEKSKQKFIIGAEKLAKAIQQNKMDIKSLENPAFTNYSTIITKLTAELKRDFQLMLQHDLPAKQETPQVEAPTGTPVPTVETPSTPIETPIAKSTFTQAFKRGQYHSQILTLQSYLKNIGLYQGEINGIYSPATIQAVYQFQLKHGVITGKEKNKSGYGRMGPKTRATLNAML